MEILKESFEFNQDARSTIQRLTFDIKRYQDKVKLFIDSNFVEMLNHNGNTEFLVEEGDKLSREVDDIMQNVAMEAKSELYAASEELKLVLLDLEEIRLGCTCSLKLLKISELFESLETAKSDDEYLVMMDLIGKLKTYLEDPNDKVSNCSIVFNMNVKCSLYSTRVLPTIQNQVHVEQFPELKNHF